MEATYFEEKKARRRRRVNHYAYQVSGTWEYSQVDLKMYTMNSYSCLENLEELRCLAFVTPLEVQVIIMIKTLRECTDF